MQILAGDIKINTMERTIHSLEYQCFTTEHGLIPVVTELSREKSCLGHIYMSGSLGNITPTGTICQNAITNH